MTTMDVGDRVNVEYKAYAAGVASTATVALTVTAPDGTTATPTPTFAAPNVYSSAFSLDQAGVWYWTWTVTGLVEDSATGQITAQNPAAPTYASVPDLRSWLNLSGTDTTRDDLLQLALETASEAVEQYCDGRRFALDAAATARTFPLGRYVICADGVERFPVDDIGALDDLLVEVSRDGVTWTTIVVTETYPDNALAKGMAISAIAAPNVRLAGYRKARVTARWGWPRVPSAVEYSTRLLAGRLARRPSSPEGVTGSSDFGLVRIPYMDPDFKALLPYLTTVKIA